MFWSKHNGDRSVHSHHNSIVERNIPQMTQFNPTNKSSRRHGTTDSTCPVTWNRTPNTPHCRHYPLQDMNFRIIWVRATSKNNKIETLFSEKQEEAPSTILIWRVGPVAGSSNTTIVVLDTIDIDKRGKRPEQDPNPDFVIRLGFGRGAVRKQHESGITNVSR